MERKIGSQNPPRTIWDLDSEWREIDFIFYSLINKQKINKHRLTSNFSSYEKQNTVNLFTEGLITKDQSLVGKTHKTFHGDIIRYTTNQIDAKEQLKEYFDRNNVEKDEMKWIDRNDNYLIEYLWAYINVARPPSSAVAFPVIPKFYQFGNNERESDDQPIIKRYIHDEDTTFPIHRKLKLDLKSGSPAQKERSIITFFDVLGECKVEKADHLNHIKDKWNKIKNRNKLLDWLHENEDLTEWALQYTKNNFLYKRLPSWSTHLDSLNEHERIKAIKITLSTIYNLIESVEARRLFMNLLTRAGVQHRHKLKAKTENKRNINIFISEEDKYDFDRIKKRKKLTAEKTLSLLIDFYLKQNHRS